MCPLNFKVSTPQGEETAQRVWEWIKSEWRSVMGRIGIQDLPRPERVLTYPRYFIAKKEGKLMNVNTSMTGRKSPERLTDLTQQRTADWYSIDWAYVEKEVNKLQVRIAKATINKKWNDVKRLQYLLTNSYYAKLLAVRKVTTNKGKNTPGVDGEIWSTPASKMKAAQKLTDKGYIAQPLRRVYIDKKNKKEKRPLGTPTMYDRAMQALYALALDPVSEATADKRSFGFRKGRSCHDACEYIFTNLARGFSPEWILEGDIKGCFDNISHEWLIANIPMDKSVLKQFLKAGFIFKRELFPTNDGTPQGGVISPILANMALDGMEEVLRRKFHCGISDKIDPRVKNANKVNFIRYADDFVVTAATPETAEQVKAVISDFLKTRGLELSDSKTLISNINEGFDFLGWTFRKFKEKLIVKPSKKSIKSFVASLSETILGRGKAWRQELLIQRLNQQIRGWANYHQSVCASEAFAHIDFILFNLLYRWAKRRHPKKGRWFVTTKYWHRRGNRSWVFAEDKTELLRVDHIPIVRHTKVRMDANPYIDTDYFVKRKFDMGAKRLSGRFKHIWSNQKGCCFHCGMPMDISDDREIFFKVPLSEGGTDTIPNMAYVHNFCNSFYNGSRSKE